MILAGDVGGTKTVLALCDDSGAIVREQTFPSAGHATFDEVVARFVGGDAVKAGGFGVAGPVADGVAKITNLPWTIDAAALARRLGGPVELLNDLQATAIGMLDVPAARWVVLQPGAIAQSATSATIWPGPASLAMIAVIAPGTGLGESLLVSDGHRYRALPSEAGHADFAPHDDDEIALSRFLRDKYGDHVSYERVLCGNGIGDLYDFWSGRLGETGPALASGDRNAAITTAALADRDPVAVRALAMFVAILGAEAGNAALRGMAGGGVAIGGGIPPKIIAALQRPGFLARFRAKGRFAPWMESLAVRVCLEPRAALLGAARTARELVAAT